MPPSTARHSFTGLFKGSTARGAKFMKGKKGSDTRSVISDTGTHVAKEERSNPTVKYFDYFYDDTSRNWKFIETNGSESASPKRRNGWEKYDFLVVRTLPRNGSFDNESVLFNITGERLRQACKDVIRSWPGVSWNSNTLELPREVFITFYSEFIRYAAVLREKEDITPIEMEILSSVEVLTSTIATDYGTILSDMQHLIAHGEITFDLLYAILIPQTIMVQRCSVTGLPLLYQLVASSRVVEAGQVKSYRLDLERIDLVDHPTTRTVMIGRVQSIRSIQRIRGTFKIADMDVYPLQYHKDPESLLEEVKQRGRKWLSLIGVHHRYYDGISARLGQVGDSLTRYNVRGRIVVDRVTFSYLNPDHKSADTVESAQMFREATPLADLDEDEMLLTPSLVFGFSLPDRMWFQLNVEKIEDINWSPDAFFNLVLEDDRKDLLLSLIEAHDEDNRLTDYIMGKGRGLIISLFGPPGVGKTLTAEATSEHLHRPIYVIGGGNLGTTALELESSLQNIFKVATAWKAILLIDEADAFLEERSINDLERSAMVAIFLRHMEYYQGILFVTTNRVNVFDDAFLSRVHVALEFTVLSQESKERIWMAFIHKMGEDAENIAADEIQELARRSNDGRVVKNAATTAHSLALRKKEKVSYSKLLAMLKATRSQL